MADHRRFFISPSQISGCEAVLEGPTAKQIAKVLRLRTGDSITLLDGCGNAYRAEIQEISPDRVVASICTDKLDDNEPRLRLVLASCLPKSDRIEFIIQKCTELGISEMILVQSERTVTRLDEDREQKRLERWRKIAREASEQCGRSRTPCLTGILGFAELVDLIPQFSVAVVAWEEEDGLSLRQAIQQKRDVDSALVIIGPEGGLTAKEVQAAKSKGAISVTLGRRLLRTDTAAVATCAAVMYEMESEL